MTDLDLRALERDVRASPDEPGLLRLALACRRAETPFPAWDLLADFGPAKARRALAAANEGSVPLKVATVRRWARESYESRDYETPLVPRRGGAWLFASLRAPREGPVMPRAQVWAFSPRADHALHDYVVLGFGRAVLSELRKVWPEEFGPKKRPTWAQLEAWFLAAPWSADRAVIRRSDLATFWAPARPSRGPCGARAFTLSCGLEAGHADGHSWRSE